MATDAEIKALALTVQASFDDRAAAALSATTSKAAMARVAELAGRHRVEGLTWAGMQQSGVELPSDLADTLRTRAGEIAANHLISVGLSQKLQQAFDANQLNVGFLKGRALAALAYPRPQMKDSCDVDILVEPTQLAGAVSILRGLGYRSVEPSSEADIHRWHEHRKESVWIDPESGTQIDLHTCPIDNAALAPALCRQPNLQSVDVGAECTLQTFAQPYLYAYLCLHGASSAWFRLSWLADMAALLRGMSAEEIAALHHGAVRLGAGAASGQALLLLNRIFSTPLPPALFDKLKRQRAVRLLHWIAWRQLTSDREPTQRMGGTITLRMSQCLLGNGISFAFAELARQLREVLTRPVRPASR